MLGSTLLLRAVSTLIKVRVLLYKPLLRSSGRTVIFCWLYRDHHHLVKNNNGCGLRQGQGATEGHGCRASCKLLSVLVCESTHHDNQGLLSRVA